jgi:C4-dicarboxylate transporter DctQ subunit
MMVRLVAIGHWLRARAENVAAALLATMFFVFVIQIIFRYLLNLPVGWTNELSVVCWLWLVPFGTAFVVRESEEIRLDLIYSASPERVRRVMQVVAAVSLVALFSLSLPAVIDYVTFMKVQKTAYLKIRFDWLFSIYAIFAVAMIVRYLWLGYQAIWGRGPEAYDPTKASSGV